MTGAISFLGGVLQEVPTRALWLAAIGVACVNLPFGFWRAGTRRFTLPWFLAVHAPFPLVVGIRLATGVAWRSTTVPILVAAFFTGQFCGGRIRVWHGRGLPPSPEPPG